MSRRALGVAIAAVLIAGCGPDDAVHVGREMEPGTSLDVDAARDSEAEAAPDDGALQSFGDMRELGYLDFGEGAQDARNGVVMFDAARSSPGYDLCTSIPFATAILRSREGVERHRWRGPGDTRWTRAELLPGGDLLVIGVAGGGGPGAGSPFLARLAWDGTQHWRRPIAAHHDVELAPDGHIVVLTEQTRRDGGALAPHGVRDHLITRLTAEGQFVDELSLFDALRARPDLVALKPIVKQRESRAPANLIHANSVEWVRPTVAAAGEPFGTERVLVSCRALDAIVLIDWNRREPVWAWGPGEVLRQHEATIGDDGRILLFDNGNDERGHSRLVELDPRTGAITWEFTTPEPERFYSPGRGTAQRLPNGNVLVANSNSGEAFEVTRGGRLVWQFFNPDRNEATGRRATLRIKRYPPGLVERLLGDDS